MRRFLNHHSKAAHFNYIVKSFLEYASCSFPTRETYASLNKLCRRSTFFLNKLPRDLILAPMAPSHLRPPHPVASVALVLPVRRLAQARRPVASLALVRPVRRS